MNKITKYIDALPLSDAEKSALPDTSLQAVHQALDDDHQTFAREDEFEGDHVGFQPRPATWYKRRFMAQGLRPVGSHCWLGPALADQLAALETTS